MWSCKYNDEAYTQPLSRNQRRIALLVVIDVPFSSELEVVCPTIVSPKCEYIVDERLYALQMACGGDERAVKNVFIQFKIICGSTLSTISTSFVSRYSIRPTGVISENDTVSLSDRCGGLVCYFRAVKNANVIVAKSSAAPVRMLKPPYTPNNKFLMSAVGERSGLIYVRNVVNKWMYLIINYFIMKCNHA